jgi:hypothetical protein
MTTIVTRITNPTGGSAKGSPLTSQEIDQNFINLNDNKLEASQLNSNSVPASFTSLGVGTSASATTGEIRATNAITSYYSDERLKTNVQLIEDPLNKVMQLRGVTYNANQLAESFGFTNKDTQVGVLAGDVERVLPQAVKPAPFDIMVFENTEMSKTGENYKTVQYEKLVPLLIEAIKELNIEIKNLKGIK